MLVESDFAQLALKFFFNASMNSLVSTQIRRVVVAFVTLVTFVLKEKDRCVDDADYHKEFLSYRFEAAMYPRVRFHATVISEPLQANRALVRLQTKYFKSLNHDLVPV